MSLGHTLKTFERRRSRSGTHERLESLLKKQSNARELHRRADGRAPGEALAFKTFIAIKRTKTLHRREF